MVMGGWGAKHKLYNSEFLDVDPNCNMIRYIIENNKLIITKSDKRIDNNY